LTLCRSIHRMLNTEIRSPDKQTVGISSDWYTSIRVCAAYIACPCCRRSGQGLRVMAPPVVAPPAAAVMLETYVAGRRGSESEAWGIDIWNDRTTLPMKKGLSSSAAICVLVARAFDQVRCLTERRGEDTG
jgi:galactokinase